MTVTAKIVGGSEKALKLARNQNICRQRGGGNSAFVPRSLVIKNNKDGTVEIPDWLAKEKEILPLPKTPKEDKGK